MQRSLIFWLWNAPLNKTEIRRQIAAMHKKNIGGFFIHPMPEEFRPADFPGGMPGYLSEEYFDMVRCAVEYASELGMEAWLYDEGGWPSGTVNGRIIKERPDLATRVLTVNGEYIWSTNRPDLLNLEVTRIFINETHEKYREHMGEFFGKTIPGIFTDEPFFGALRISDSIVFSPVLEARFNQEKKYDAREAALRILRGNDPQARQDFNEIWVKLMVENYLAPLREWCHKNNLIFTGHFNGDDCIDNMELLLGSDIFTLTKELDLPGCDAIWRQIHPLMPETDYSRIISSAAGNRPSVSETFAVYGTDLSLAEMKYTAAMQFIAGIRIIAPMAFHYSNAGGRQITTVSNFAEADPRWQYFDFYFDFVTRMSKVFDRTEPVIKAHIPFPRTALQRGECADREVFAKGLKLAAQQITYDYQPDAAAITDPLEHDIYLTEQCADLRTRHLRSPRGERRIFANAGTEAIACKFTAPAGFNAWYDPATGKHWSACADANGLLSLELPFSGCMVLLTIPGISRAVAETVCCTGKTVEFKFSEPVNRVKASPDGLVKTDAAGEVDENFCGTLRYKAGVELAESGKVKLLLPNARRAMCELFVNGKSAGARVWQPYCWEIELPAGETILTMDISNTPNAAVTSSEHQKFLHENSFDNIYWQRCMKFEKLFPNEKTLDGAQLI